MPLRCAALVGPAGTGKTTILRERLAKDPLYARLTATTGIAAVNLGEGVTTIHSALRFYDYRGALAEQQSGKMTGKFTAMAAAGIKWLVIDEVSMMSAQLLDIIYEAADDAFKLCEAGAIRVKVFREDGTPEQNPNGTQKYRNSIGDDATGLLLTGDFCQLPPVSGGGDIGDYAFNAKCWPAFEENLEKLTTVYRQTNPSMLKALTLVRQGKAVEAAIDLKRAGVKFAKSEDIDFDGITLFPTNSQLLGFNERKLAQLPGEVWRFRSERWGSPANEWGNIPDLLELKKSALVMCLANNPPSYSFVNGDLATIEEFHPALLMDDGEWFECDDDNPRKTMAQGVTIRTKRGSYFGEMPYCNRLNVSYDKPRVASVEERFNSSRDGMVRTDIDYYHCNDLTLAEVWQHEGRSDRYIAMYLDYQDRMVAMKEAFYIPDLNAAVVGGIRYMPLRLAYGSTFHKCLTPDSLACEKTLGVVPVERIEAGHHVYTRDSYAEVLAVAQTEQTVTRVVTANGYEVTCSPEHRFPIGECPSGEHSVLTAAQDLKAGDKLTLSFMLPNKGSDINERLAYLFGLLVGDGSYADLKEGNVHFSTHCEPLQDAFVDLVEGELNVHAGRRRDGKGCFFTSKPVRYLMQVAGFDYVLAPFKTVPKMIFASGVKPVAAFLRGLMDTDGSVARTHIVYATSSEVLSKQVQLLFLGLGIFTTRATYQGAKCPYYQLRIAGAEVDKFKMLVGFDRPDRKEKLAALTVDYKRCKKLSRIEPVKEVQHLKIKVPMVDLEIDSQEHVFSANGIVTHNTQGLTLDSVQLMIGNQWAAQPSMMYVALSRCRTPEGITIVGDVARLSRRVNTAREVLRWV